MIPWALVLLLLPGGARPGPPSSPLRCPPGDQGACKEAPPPGPRCPAPLSFPLGSFRPRRRSYPPGSVLAFSCDPGSVLRGPARRLCRPGGLWSGSSPVCDDGEGSCPPAPAPAGGAVRGRGRGEGAVVHVTCGAGLVLVGPARRRCLETGRWSGPEPTCRAPSSYDVPEDVVAALAPSLSSTLELAGALPPDHGSSLARRIVLRREGGLHLYLLLDASGSVAPDTFRLFKECAAAIVDRLSSFEVSVSFSIVSFASRALVVLSTAEDAASDADEVLQRLETMSLADHGNATGTNVGAALREVQHMILFQKARAAQRGHPEAWKDVHHVLILLTDGRFNVGGRPEEAVAKIEDVLEVKPDREDHLEIYAFGVGSRDVSMAELAAVATGRGDEPHAFQLPDAAALRRALEAALEATDLGDLCGVLVPSDAPRPPWHVVLKTGRTQRCAGSLLGGVWVLTAAHCFWGGPEPQAWSAELEGGQLLPVRRWILHDDFVARGGVPEFYDYDVALVELGGAPSTPKRVCLPCTEDANRALRSPPGTSCEEQEAQLLGAPPVPAEFVTLEPQRLRVKIWGGPEVSACWGGDTEGPPQIERVTERFLCSEGEGGAAACKGESGGAVTLERRHRFIQVGVLSWGTQDACRGGRRGPPPPESLPPEGPPARDFHLSLFRVQAWLRRHLRGALPFAPRRDPRTDTERDPETQRDP